MSLTNAPDAPDAARARVERYEAAARLRPWNAVAMASPASAVAEASTALDLLNGARRSANAVTYFDGRFDYAELDTLSDRLASWWHTRGVSRGDRVAIVLQNTPAFIIASLAAWKLSAIVVPLNPMYQPPELARLFDDCTPAATVCHDDQWDTFVRLVDSQRGASCLLWSSPRDMQSRGDRRVLPAPPDATPPVAHSMHAVLQAASRPLLPNSTPGVDDVAVLLYTSGTTGLPKGAMLTHRNLVVNARASAGHFALSHESRAFALAPMFHVTGLVQMLMAIAASANHVLVYRFQPDVVLDAFLEHRPTFVVGAITAFIALMNRPGVTTDHFSSFDHVCSGGAPIAPAVVAAFERGLGRSIRTSYGMTELAAASHIAPVCGDIPVDPATGALAIGKPTPVVDVIVVDDKGDPVGPREPGELLVRGPNVMTGYWGKPADTAAAMTGGWLHTGDVGFFDEGGWFYLLDRKKDMISASGFKVWPREVEDVLYAFAGVREAAVVGAPDAYRGETVVAFLAPQPGASLDREALRMHCRERLAAYKCPTAFHVLSDLPKTASGKITRSALAKSLRE